MFKKIIYTVIIIILLFSGYQNKKDIIIGERDDAIEWHNYGQENIYFLDHNLESLKHM